MLKSWSDNNKDTQEDVRESSVVEHNEIVSSFQGSFPYYSKRG
jgi:hypothetical protein